MEGVGRWGMSSSGSMVLVCVDYRVAGAFLGFGDEIETRVLFVSVGQGA